MSIITSIKNFFVFIFVKNLFKILLVISLSIVMFIALFPKNELSDFVSKTVSDQTHNQIKLDFEDLSFTSNLGIQLDRVFFEMAGRPPITLKELMASPDIMAAINKKPYGKIKVRGLFSGDAEISITKHRPEGDADKKIEQSLIAVNAAQIDLMSLKSFLNLPFELRGRADLNAKAVSVLQLVHNPEAPAPPFQLIEVPELTLTVKNFDMPAFTLEQGLPLPMNIPGVRLSEIVLKARLFENTFQIQELHLGRPNDELAGTIKGTVTLMKGPMMFPERYEITTDLKMRQSFHDKISLLLPILNAERFVQPLPSGGGYTMKSKISWAMGRALPSFDSAR